MNKESDRKITNQQEDDIISGIGRIEKKRSKRADVQEKRGDTNLTAGRNDPSFDHLKEDQSIEHIVLNIENENEIHQKSDEKLVENTYSFIITAKYSSPAFVYAMAVFFFQSCLLGIIMFDLIAGNPADNPLGVPPGVDQVVTVAQAFSIVLAAAYQDDVMTALIMFHHGFKSFEVQVPSLVEVSNVEGIGKGISDSLKGETFRSPCFKWFFASFLQFTVGSILLVDTFILVIQSSTVIEMMLNFAALEFVSQIDDIAFSMGKRGFVSNKVQRESNDVLDYKIPDSRKESSNVFRRILFLVVLAGLSVGFGIVVHQQKSGRFLCSSIGAQFHDDYNRPSTSFSGTYDKQDGWLINGRAVYIERSSKSAMLAYCQSEGSWTFTRWINDTALARKWYPDESLYIKDDPCKWFARSPETTTYDVASVADAEWFTFYERHKEARKFTYFAMWCNDCNEGNKGGKCHVDNGKCVDNECVCNDGKYGLNCQFPDPCPTLVVDKRESLFPNRVLGETFHLLRDENNKPLEIYDRAVYFNDEVGDGSFINLIMFFGRRWMIGFYNRKAVKTYLFGNNSETRSLTTEALGKFLKNEIRAYYPPRINVMEYKLGLVIYISEAVDVGGRKDTYTPTGVLWYDLSNQYIDFSTNVEETEPISSKLVCGYCDDETNHCFNGGTCKDSTDGDDDLKKTKTPRGVCECPYGFSGSLCEYVQPCSFHPSNDTYAICLNNGLCDESSGACSCSGEFHGHLCQFDYNSN